MHKVIEVFYCSKLYSDMTESCHFLLMIKLDQVFFGQGLHI